MSNLPLSLPLHRSHRAAVVRRWAGMVLLALALVWQTQALWRHQLDGHANAASGHACVECLAFAGADHALPVLPVAIAGVAAAPMVAVAVALWTPRAAPALYQARAPPR